MLDDVAQADEAALGDTSVLGREALLHMLSDPIQVGSCSLSHQDTNLGLHRM